jgi:hypothetical protein
MANSNVNIRNFLNDRPIRNTEGVASAIQKFFGIEWKKYEINDCRATLALLNEIKLTFEPHDKLNDDDKRGFDGGVAFLNWRLAELKNYINRDIENLTAGGGRRRSKSRSKRAKSRRK